MSTPWEHALRNVARTPEAAQQIADAREEPTPVELDAERMAEVDRKLRVDDGCFGPGPVPPSLTLTGPQLDAYLCLRDAATAAHQAQRSMATTGAALRDAIQGLCAAIAPGSKP